jgi:hypothetical protein
LDEAEKWAAETTSGTVEILEVKTAVTVFRPAEPPPVPKRVG